MFNFLKYNILITYNILLSKNFLFYQNISFDCVVNNDFLWCAVLCDILLPFPAEAVVQHYYSTTHIHIARVPN